MKDYRGVVYNSIDNIQTREAISTIDDFLRQLTFGVASIAEGNAPDSSGNPIPGLGDYFFLPGRSGNQDGAGGTLPGGTLRLTSTRNATKGKLYWGASSALDERNTLLGIGTTAPDAAGHFVGNPQPGTATIVTASSAGDSNYHNTGAWETQIGLDETNMINVSNCLKLDDDAAFYLSANLSGAATRSASCKTTGTFSPGLSYTVRFKARRTGSVDATTTFNVALTGSDGTVYSGATSTPSTRFTTSWAYYTDTVTLTSGGATGQPTNCARVICANNVTEGTRVDVTYVEVLNAGTNPGSAILIAERTASTTSPYAKFIDESDVVVTQITSTGKVSSTVAPQWDTAAATTGDLWVASDNDGNGDWVATSALTIADVVDSVFRIIGSSDATKKLAFEVDGFTTDTTRTLTPQNASYTIAALNLGQTFTGDQAFSNDVTVAGTLYVRRDTGTAIMTQDVAQTFQLFRVDAASGQVHAGDVSDTLGIPNALPLTLYNGDTTGDNVAFYTGLVTGSRVITIPDATGVLILSGQNAQLVLTSGSTLRTSTQTVGVAFEDTTVTSRKLRVILSTAAGNNAFRINSSAARIYDFPDASITVAGSAAALTDTRVPFATTGGILTDDSDMTFTGGDTLNIAKIVNGTSLKVAGGAVLTALTAGVYTPTITNTTNVAASTAFEAQYLRVGNTVTVSGRVDIDPTTAGIGTIIGISLPVASNLGANEDCVGIMNGSTGTAEAGYIASDTTNDRAAAAIIPTSAANASFYFHFTYQVI